MRHGCQLGKWPGGNWTDQAQIASGRHVVLAACCCWMLLLLLLLLTAGYWLLALGGAVADDNYSVAAQLHTVNLPLRL